MAIGQLNPTQLSARLAVMSDQQLQQYAALHQDDPFVLAIAMDVKNQRDATRSTAVPPQTPQPTVVQQLLARMAQLPPAQGGQGQQMPAQQLAQPPAPQQPADGDMSGIAKLPAQNIAQMKEGGIAGYAAGDVTTSDPKQAFALRYKDLAERVGEELGVDPGLIIAQWGLETGWGSKTVGQYNFGNIKDTTGKGPRAKDVAEGSYDAYRQYNSPEEFAADYVSQMKRNWPQALGAGRDPAKFAEGLQKGRLGPYATAPNYGAALANTFRSLVPSAQAAPVQPQTQAVPSPGKRFATADEIAQIRQGVPLLAQGDIELPPSARPAPTPEKPSVSPLAHIFKGAPETALTLGSGILAPVLGVAKSGLQRLAGFPVDEARVNKNVESYIYSPRSEAGRRQVEGIAQVAEELKIPPFIPAIGGVSGAARASRAAQTAERAAADAAAASAKVAAPRLTPPSTAATTPARERSLAAARQAEFQKDQAAAKAAQTQAADAAQTAAARRAGVQRQMADVGYAQGAAQRAGLAGIAGMGAQTAAAANAPAAETDMAAAQPQGPREMGEAERNKFMEANASPQTVAASIAKAEKVLSPEQRKGMSWEDLMMFGFALMAGQSPYALQNVGAAGIAALQGKQAREKAEREQLLSASKAKQEEAMAKYYEAYAGAIDRGAKEKNDVIAAEKLVQDALAKWESSLQGKLAASNPTLRAQEEARLRREIYGQLGLEVTKIPGATAAPADTGGFKVVGVRNP